MAGVVLAKRGPVRCRMLKTIQMSDSIHELLVDEARNAYPEECCGILVGRERRRKIDILRVVCAENITQGDRCRSYQVDWRVLFSTVRETRAGHDRIVGFYHSHPDGTISPSARDQAEVWIDYSYVIVTLSAGAHLATSSWRVVAAGRPFVEEQLVYC